MWWVIAQRERAARMRWVCTSLEEVSRILDLHGMKLMWFREDQRIVLDYNNACIGEALLVPVDSERPT